MSPIFRHGRLRLYLLKLLDEAPRHGYEVIRLLQDRFMGVYSPSPGTIYPRLARLEDDGLVTHDEVDGRKVYRITEKGREEIRGRLDDLVELEEELTESVRDIAREVSEDVRDTVRSLREEITSAARDIRRDGRGRPGPEDRDSDPEDIRTTGELRGAAGRTGGTEAREDIRDAFRPHGGGGRAASAGGARSARPGGARPGGAASGGARSGGARAGSGRADWAGFAGRGGLPAGLDRLASDFARDLSHVAGHAGDLGEGALGDLKGILADALTRIRDEVFTPAGDAADPATADAEDTYAAADEARADDGAWAAGTREAETPGPETQGSGDAPTP